MRRIVLVFLALAAILFPAPLRAEVTGPALKHTDARLAKSLHCPKSFTDSDGEPVLLVHGTFTDDRYNWSWGYKPALAARGLDVCTVTLPDHSLGDMQGQAEFVVYAVRQMHARTGRKVDIAGASQGTLHPRWAVKWWPDVRDAVDDMVFLAGPHHGTSATSLIKVLRRCYYSCWQMSEGSNYLRVLNADDETPGDISYTSIYTLTDELVQPQFPTSTSALHGAVNIATQDVCPARTVDHATLSTTDAVGFALAFDAFTHPGPAAPARFDPVTCGRLAISGSELSTAPFHGGSVGILGPYRHREPALKPYAQ